MMKVKLTKRQVNALEGVLDQLVDTYRLAAPNLTGTEAREDEKDLNSLLDILDAAGRDTSEMRGRMADLDAIFGRA
jgi:hypothetical protein